MNESNVATAKSVLVELLPQLVVMLITYATRFEVEEFRTLRITLNNVTTMEIILNVYKPAQRKSTIPMEHNLKKNFRSINKYN